MILENYLFLLTEDPETDKLDGEYYKSRKEVLKAGVEAEPLNAKYHGLPENKIPEHHRKIIQNHKKKVMDFADISKKRQEYSTWIRGGKKGPKPGTIPKYAKYNYNGGRNAEAMRKYASRQMRSRNIMIATIFIAYILFVSKGVYDRYFNKAAMACKKLYGIDKEFCIMNFRLNALIKQREILKNNISKCNSTNNPEKCKRELNDRIASISKKIDKTRKIIKEVKSAIEWKKHQ